MKPEYGLSQGERGKFFRPSAELRLPIYLSADVQNDLADRAAQKGIPLAEMVNTLLKQEIQMIEPVVPHAVRQESGKGDAARTRGADPGNITPRNP